MAERTDDEPAFSALLDHVKRTRNFDFSGYKRGTLHRRIDKRLQTLRLDSYGAYLDHLQVHPDEFTAFFNTILINVTSFFRDLDAWEHLQQEVLPGMLQAKDPGEPIRVWSAGCASGEETYSIAIVLCELLGADLFVERVKIYGTDVDEEALADARSASYDAEDIARVPEPWRERYFEPPNGGGPARDDVTRLQFRGDLRRNIIFGRHDLIQDAPISRLDLLVCRNTLMYFNSDVQAHALDRFHFALQPGGVLFLGKAEKLLRSSRLFEPIDAKRRFFRKVPTGEARQRLLQRVIVDAEPAVANVALRDRAFDVVPLPTVAVDRDGHLLLANAPARQLFRLSLRDLGRPLRDLELSYRPVELRAAIERAYESGGPVQLQDVRWQVEPDVVTTLDVLVQPLPDDDGGVCGTAITFADISDRHRLRDQLAESRSRLASAYEELQSSNEELETTNEELQSTIEELETTNEELQSTNEELETMNEELQSTNDELHVANEELFQRQRQLNDANAFLAAVLRSLRRAVVVVDEALLVRVWNDLAEDLWGLRSDEVVGTNLLDLDVGLPVHELRDPLRASLAGEDDTKLLVLPARNRRGMPVECHVSCMPLHTDDGAVKGAILLMEERRRPDTT
ncbi:CheR family methyltransferase [Egicoccus sp. AB-alg2]|uniref:CheR family methyltransferase n=1 Tax=Egicoccus sp. AB-alg2 TaxID=3242693 RepID=UPI00359E160F